MPNNRTFLVRPRSFPSLGHGQRCTLGRRVPFLVMRETADATAATRPHPKSTSVPCTESHEGRTPHCLPSGCAASAQRSSPERGPAEFSRPREHLRKESRSSAYRLGTSAFGVRMLRATSLSYKTELCRHFARGRCFRGASCDFAHGTTELRPLWAPSPSVARCQRPRPACKSAVCRHWRRGYCREGARCGFAHGEAEIGLPLPGAGVVSVTADASSRSSWDLPLGSRCASGSTEPHIVNAQANADHGRLDVRTHALCFAVGASGVWGPSQSHARAAHVMSGAETAFASAGSPARGIDAGHTDATLSERRCTSFRVEPRH
jgi:hypothetical protein